MPAQIQRGLEIVPGYTLVRRVGSGMAGEVWVARASGGVHVAIKLIRDLDMVGSKRELGALRIIREVKHTNLCPLIGVWFFDRDGELLSNAATDEILGQDTSLIDTDFLSTRYHPSNGLSDTDQVRISDADTNNGGRHDGQTTGPLADGESDSGFAETSDLSGFDLSGGESDQPPLVQTWTGDGRPADAPDSPREDRESDPLDEARQMVVAMGLGDQTLFDRLIEMRAPGNHPEEPDPLHIPGGIPAKELIRYLEGAASAIDELNLKHNIYHCDIKPQNILVVGGNTQVCDFGLARRVHENRRTQLAIGTPAYGAPEMLFDQTYTKTIDQYSLAITYYELRTGKLPFETTRRSMFLRAKAQGELHLDALPDRERAVIAKAANLEPDERYSTCVEFIEALTSAIEPKPVAVSNDRKLFWLGATGVVLTACALSVTAFPILKKAATQPAQRSPSLTPEQLPVEMEEVSALPKVIEPIRKEPDLTIDPVESKELDMSSTSTVEPIVTAPMEVDPRQLIAPEPLVGPRQPPEIERRAKEPEVASLSPTMQPEDSASPTVRRADDLEEPKKDDEVSRVDQVKEMVALANNQAKQLIDQFTPMDSSSSNRKPSAANVKNSIALVKDLDVRRIIPKNAKLTTVPNKRRIKPGDEVLGWDLLDRPLALPATAIAGLLEWDATRPSGAFKKWISIQNEDELTNMVSVSLRLAITERVLLWLIKESSVDDSNIGMHRYADSIQRTDGILKLVRVYASDSQETLRSIERERFLLAAAQENGEDGLSIWNSLELLPTDMTPQMGIALARLVDARLRKPTGLDENVRLAGYRITASEAVSQKIAQRRTSNTTKSQTIIETDRRASFALLKSVAGVSQGTRWQLPPALANSQVGEFCVSYVDQMTQLDPTVSYQDFLERLRDIQIAAEIAVKHATSSERQNDMRLVAVEAIVRARSEHYDETTPSQYIGQLETLLNQSNANSPSQWFVNAQILDEQGALARDEEQMLEAYGQARSLYSRVLDAPSTPEGLRGSAARCRALLLTRLAAVGEANEKQEWLDQATGDAELSLQLPSRWYNDNDDRLMTAAEVNLSKVRLLTDLSIQHQKSPANSLLSSLLDDADQYLVQAIAEREMRGHPTFQQATLKLNGLLLGLLNSSAGPRKEQLRETSLDWIETNATKPVTPEFDGVPQTIPASSTRLQCHWHCICSMVMSTLEDPEAAMAQINYAHALANDRLEANDDRRHFATLVLVQLKSQPLVQRSLDASSSSDSSGAGETKATLIAELNRLLDSIVDPLPTFRKKKALYQKELADMLR